MRRDHLRTAALTGLAIAAGWIGWSGQVVLLPATLAFPAIWALVPNRVAVGLVSAGYFLAASRGLPQGAAAFYSYNLWPGLFLWLVASISFLSVHTVLWTSVASKRPHRFLAAALLMALPPFGITGWAHPITAAGVLFPGWGWWGLAATTAGLIGLVSWIWPAVAIALTGAWAWSAATWTDPEVPRSWRGVDLEMGASLGREADLSRQRDLISKARGAADDGVGYIVLPESALGFWTPTVERLWTKALVGSSVTVIAGAAVVDADGYDNVLVEMSAAGARVLYRERMPVPGSMWQPWRSWWGDSEGAQADFFANPIVVLHDRKLAPLICYEQLIAWPVLQSMLHDPDVIVAVGNGWWTANTSIVAIQRASVEAWARLFAKPLVISFNA
ncbi:conjugal transfer protein TraB [Rhizobium leguminosarum]|uniref:Conjugal transfer protein TraB n=1 Tax=Rhizobium leguminosarum TaxID=384 RepID=A0A7M3DL73_RHILE|nr:conjugal transfer protein TraB [Rhizobium leguminosarum]TAY43080.1 conjugal transfer protein TraB [Rhizobium leguminosarum]TBZ41295.1 conjugal transfer protein TraB [Rhizobium leguminosarum bv. viciae]TCA09447.1 conjugal transfer protein TraB [Rhizobium leguminosarum bv. viciae]TCA18840.1 conjugal transfer protein TraB [Rhizobium leguminosarum bv. viciae]